MTNTSTIGVRAEGRRELSLSAILTVLIEDPGTVVLGKAGHYVDLHDVALVLT